MQVLLDRIYVVPIERLAALEAGPARLSWSGHAAHRWLRPMYAAAYQTLPSSSLNS
jgi:hypothetical protein